MKYCLVIVGERRQEVISIVVRLTQGIWYPKLQ